MFTSWNFELKYMYILVFFSEFLLVTPFWAFNEIK